MISPKKLICALFAGLLLISGQSYAKTTVLVIGDSLSAAYGLPTEDGWVHLLKNSLTEQGHDIEFINDSISGDTTAGGVVRVADMLSRLEADWVIIALGANDGLRGSSLEAVHDNLINMVNQVERAGASAILFGMRLPPNYGKTYTESFEKLYQDVADATNVPLLPFFIEGAAGFPQYNLDDGIHPNSEGQKIIKRNVEDFLKQVLGL